MKHFSLPGRDRWTQRLLAIALAGFLSLTSLLTVAVQPSWAQIPFDSKEAHGQTKEQLTGRSQDAPLSNEERRERAYTMSEAAGQREEIRQSEGKSAVEGHENLAEEVKATAKRIKAESNESH